MAPNQYSPLEHIGRSIWGTRYSQKSLFAMLSCYFDEAGGVDQGFIVVSGYVSTVEQWQRFETDWRLFLAKFDVPYLHMKSFAHFKGPFAKWKGNEGTRSQFLSYAAGIISDYAQHAFSHYVEYAAFEDLSKEYNLKAIVSSPYALAGRSCVAQANIYHQHDLRDIEYIFEDGGPDKAGLVTAMTRLKPRLQIPIFKPSRDTKIQRGVLQLQAADFLAYEVRKNIADQGGRPTRKSIEALSSKVPHKWIFHDRATLDKFCRRTGLSRRANHDKLES
jgi:hypothetical protein